MNKEVKISINGNMAYGNYFYKNNSHFIVFEDVQDSGEKCQNRVKINEELIEYTRTGALRCVMTFKVGTDYLVEYMTPMGRIDFTIKTTEIRRRMEENLIRVVIKYQMINAGDEDTTNCEDTEISIEVVAV